jgi:hypothetical protein
VTDPNGDAASQSSARPLRWVGVDRQTAEYLPNDLTPAQVETAIAPESVEWMYVFDPGGRQIARFRGTPDKVDLSDDLKRRTGALGLYGDPMLKDHLIVHNHPPETDVESFPLSRADLLFAVTRDLSRFVVVTGPFFATNSGAPKAAGHSTNWSCPIFFASMLPFWRKARATSRTQSLHRPIGYTRPSN